jgi:hypothetical protein
MNLSDRLAELTQMKTEGKLSEREFEALAKLAKDQSNGDSLTSSNEIAKGPSKPIYLRAKVLAGSAVVVTALVFFVLLQSRSSDPLESKEYRKLLDMKTELITKQAELEAELSSKPDLAEYSARISSEVRRLRDAIAMINESGL